jgi:hypothetical protein
VLRFTLEDSAGRTLAEELADSPFHWTVPAGRHVLHVRNERGNPVTTRSVEIGSEAVSLELDL